MVRRIAMAGLAAALGAAAFASPAAAIPFGANLNQPANVNFDCTVLAGPPPAFTPGFTVLPSGFPSCTWMNVGSAANLQQGTFVAPIAGTVTQVSVRVGAVTGPMQVVVMRSFRDFFSTTVPVCCTEVARTPVFTPTPNSVTTIATALPVRKDTIPDPINNTVTFDSLALSVLAPNVPVPAFDTGRHDPSDFSIPTAAVYHPAVGPNQERFISSGVGGFQVLMAADVTPSPTGAGPVPQAPAGVGPGVTAPIALVGRVLAINNGAVRLPIRCALVGMQCIGTVRLQSGAIGAASAAAKKKKRLKTYGTAKVRIPAGKQAMVRIRLSKAGRKLVRKKRRTKVWANATVGGMRIAPARMTLRRR
jgi:hypothetical protein